ncbi:anti-sigma factor family protein [Nonomuraea sediminis]|uniref:anti-sigma factor family protein n=1 Tax=Nonomuraea sediminis TaxID=2835864 RepID=UPI001BDD35BE|nr:zf-HC2 domain-containing protein [Nonomuraea sediminis]
MTGDTHYDLEILAELAEGLLDAGTARQVREHLAVCDPCGELLADLAAVREVLAATPTPAMPMGVALRIDKALAAEAGAAGGGVGLVTAPDWDDLMRDAPWESKPVEEPVRLGVVNDDGTIRVAQRRRRRWAMPAVAAAAAAVVVGTAAVSTGLLASGGGTPSTGGPQLAQSASPPKDHTKAKRFTLTDSGHNYSDGELRQPLEGFLAPAPIVGGGSADVDKVTKCVNRINDRSNLKAFAVDQGQYNGQDALVVTSWKDKAAKRVRVDVIDPYNCKPLRKAILGRW